MPNNVPLICDTDSWLNQEQRPNCSLGGLVGPVQRQPVHLLSHHVEP